MLNKLLLAAGFSVAFALPALAQQSPSSSTSDSSSKPSSSSDSQQSSSDRSSSGSGGMTMRQNLKQDLTKGGFTDVKVVPSSFFVRAVDKNGHHVMMMIGPDSVMTITDPNTKMSKSKSSGDMSSGSNSGSSSNGTTTQ